jgi:hypothetical protein
MPPVFAKFLAFLLVLAHTGVASVRGLELCVPVGSCGGDACAVEHDHGGAGCTEDGCDGAHGAVSADARRAHDHEHGHEHDGKHDGKHEHSHSHGLVSAHDPAHAHDDCGCHVHVAIPDQDQSPRGRAAELVQLWQPPQAVVAVQSIALALIDALGANARSSDRPPWPPGLAETLSASPDATRRALRATVILV